MTEENKEPLNAETEAWSKNWLVPVLLLMLREWSSYGYELMEKMAAFGLTTMNAGTFYRTLRQMEKDEHVLPALQGTTIRRRQARRLRGQNRKSQDTSCCPGSSCFGLFTNPFY